MKVPHDPTRLPTIIGAGGVKLINLPGLVHPESALHTRKEYDKKTNQAYDVAPEGYVSAKEAAKMLKISRSAASVKLARNKVKRVIVKTHAAPPSNYYPKAKIIAMIDKSAPIIDSIPAGWMTVEKTAESLGVSRSAIQRAIRSGLIGHELVRVSSGQGLRKLIIISPDHIKSYLSLLEVKRDEQARKVAQIQKNLNTYLS